MANTRAIRTRRTQSLKPVTRACRPWTKTFFCWKPRLELRCSHWAAATLFCRNIISSSTLLCRQVCDLSPSTWLLYRNAWMIPAVWLPYKWLRWKNILLCRFQLSSGFVLFFFTIKIVFFEVFDGKAQTAKANKILVKLLETDIKPWTKRESNACAKNHWLRPLYKRL